MRFRSRLATGFAVMVATLLAPLAERQVLAQPASKDIAVVSIGPLDSTLRDIPYLLRACNVAEAGGFISLMAGQYTQGIDKSKPIGAKISLDGGMPNAVIFMPMTDTQQFFDALAGIGIEPDDLGGGMYEIDTGGQTVFAKESGGWMFVAQTEDALSDTPADPAAMLGSLPKNYDLAIRVNARNVPQEMKDQAIEQIRIGFERGMAEQAGQSEEEQARAKEMGEASVEQLARLISDTDQMIFGWSISKEEQRTFMDGGVQFREGTDLAKQSEAAANVTSDYTGFILPDAAAKFRFTSEIPEGDRELVKNNFRNSMDQAVTQMEQSGDLPPEAEGLLKEILGTISKAMEDTIDEGIFDGGGSVSVAENTLRVLIGGRIASGSDLADGFKQAAGKLPDGAPEIDFDYDTYKGVTLHKVAIPVKIADPAAREALGDSLNVVIGTAEKSFLLAMDPEGDSLVKKVIDQAETKKGVKVAPFESVVHLNDILTYAQSISPNSILDNVIGVMAEYSENDKVEVTSRLIARGAVYRLSIDEGVLRGVGTAARSGAEGGGF